MRIVLPIATLAALFSIGAVAAIATRPAPAVTLVRVPHGGIQPEVAVDGRGVVHLLYFSGEPRAGNLFYTRSTDHGQTFSTPIRVNSQNGSAIASGTIRGGQLAAGRGGRVHVTWNGSDTATPRGLINPANDQPSAPFLYTRSNGDGTAFEPQRNLTRRSYGVDGGGSLAADDDGNVYAVWHALAVGGETGEDHRLVWISRSSDDGATFSEERAASSETTGACGCCGLRLLAPRPNNLYLLYRSAAALTHRDIYLLESSDSGASFRGTQVQPWNIGACPMTSMSIAAAGSRMVGAWETAGQVYFGEIDPNKARIPNPIAAPSEGGTRKHPRVALGGDGDVLFVWTEDTAWARGGSVAWRIFDRSGKPTSTHGSAPGVPVWSFAAAIARPDGGFTLFY